MGRRIVLQEPLLHELQQTVRQEVSPVAASPEGQLETGHALGGTPATTVIPGAVVTPPATVAPPPAAEAPPTSKPEEGIQGVQGVQWLALTDLQFARHDLLLGLNVPAMNSLVAAKIYLTLLGKPFAAELTALERTISRLQTAPILSLGQLDHDIESLKETWVRVMFSSDLQAGGGLLGWLTPWHHSAPQKEHTELETTDAGRQLVARLDRLKWLALWGDEYGFRQASTTLPTLLGLQFQESSAARPWLIWIRGLQRIPLRHDVTDINTLIVRLSRRELPP
jgi:hypothetical protein